MKGGSRNYRGLIGTDCAESSCAADKVGRDKGAGQGGRRAMECLAATWFGVRKPFSGPTGTTFFGAAGCHTALLSRHLVEAGCIGARSQIMPPRAPTQPRKAMLADMLASYVKRGE